MIKKIVLGVLFVGLISVLVIGAINRTMAKDRQSEDVLGQSEGVDHQGVVEDQDGSPAAQQFGEGSGGKDQSGGSGGGTSQAVIHEWLELQGEVESMDEAALTVALPDEKEVILDAREWQFAQEQGFSAQVGDQVILYGFYQEGDFKPGQLDDLTNGMSVILRNSDGKPLWSGGGKSGD
ncbi:MAG: hypothetical protein A2Z14_05485 [Chloroflexi bacterium RBG_16_48_8]|nr:MAG: hypothetical protein A2Z14_05485 [Chloroflexi bacterium RBG_16_48_8]